MIQLCKEGGGERRGLFFCTTRSRFLDSLWFRNVFFFRHRWLDRSVKQSCLSAPWLQALHCSFCLCPSCRLTCVAPSTTWSQRQSGRGRRRPSTCKAYAFCTSRARSAVGRAVHVWDVHWQRSLYDSYVEVISRKRPLTCRNVQ